MFNYRRLISNLGLVRLAYAIHDIEKTDQIEVYVSLNDRSVQGIRKTCEIVAEELARVRDGLE